MKRSELKELIKQIIIEESSVPREVTIITPAMTKEEIIAALKKNGLGSLKVPRDGSDPTAQVNTFKNQSSDFIVKSLKELWGLNDILDWDTLEVSKTGDLEVDAVDGSPLKFVNVSYVDGGPRGRAIPTIMFRIF
jgi:hypothetical protein